MGVGVGEEPGREGHQELSRVTEVSSVFIWPPDRVCLSELRTVPSKGYVSMGCEFYVFLCKSDLGNNSLLE